ncbi:MAG: polysaccharide pyruvyl transferase family protein [Lachnospiraceae bacterium]|nr:polysaccharide pyruvyl transferase family protein [Lachnospiraceae bacterium]
MRNTVRRYANLIAWKVHKLYDWIDISDIIKVIKEKKNTECYLLDTPIHGNLGDQAISVAEMQFFSKSNITVKEISSSKLHNKEKIYSKVIPTDKNIFVQGGGFLGILWPKEEERFRNILRCFKNHKIVVFPQTVTFDIETKEGIQFLQESQYIYSQHKDLTIFVREKKSYKFMLEYFPGVKCFLVPDIVTVLRNKVNVSYREGIIFCMRSDIEKKISDDAEALIKEFVCKKYPNEEIEYTDTVLTYRISSSKRELEVKKKLQQFANSKLVITDRLHGMIFAAITGTPCIAMNNCNGKIENVYEWIKANHYIKYASDLDEFQNKLNELDIEEKYVYNYQLVDDELNPLYELIKNINGKH